VENDVSLAFVLSTRIAIREDRGVLQALSRLALDEADKSAVLDEIGVNLAENTRLRFIEQEGPDGERWEPSLRAQAEGGETLRDTGRLMNSINHVVLGDGVEVGTNVDYALPLHFGITITPVNSPYLTFKVPGGGWANKTSVVIPSRPFIGISEDDGALIIDIIDHFLRIQ
jgi:phage gpG-like protein